MSERLTRRQVIALLEDPEVEVRATRSGRVVNVTIVDLPRRPKEEPDRE